LLSPVNPGADPVIVREPKLTPITFGAVAGEVWPCGINTAVGVIVAFSGSELASVTVTPPAGALVARVTCIGTDCPGVTTTFDCSAMDPSLPTLMFAEPLVYPAELPVITAGPSARPVTVKVPVVDPAGMFTIAGWISMMVPWFVATRTAVPPGGAGADSTTSPVIEREMPIVLTPRFTVIAGIKTFTVVVPGRKPGTDAVNSVEPIALGVIVTFIPVEP
jgi:hypothetical protein